MKICLVESEKILEIFSKKLLKLFFLIVLIIKGADKWKRSKNSLTGF